MQLSLDKAFNQEEAQVGAFSVIVKTDGSFVAVVHRFYSEYLLPAYYCIHKSSSA